MGRRRSRRAASRGDRIRIFISHASSDVALAAAVVNLLRSAFNLPADAIRCTSVDGYRLPGGASIDEQLKREVHSASAFIGLVSPASIQSIYVLFELGARWGADRHMLPLLAPGITPKVLRGPIANLNALRSDRAAELHQFVGDVAPLLRRPIPAAPTYQGALDRILELQPRQRPEERMIKTLKKQRRTLEKEREAAEYHVKTLVPAVKRVELTCAFDESGSGHQVRRWAGIRASQAVVNLKIPYSFAASSPGGRAFAPADIVREMERPRSALAVQFRRRKGTPPGRVQGDIIIMGHLTPTTRFVGFDVRQPFESAFCMTRKELARAYRHDLWKTEYIGILAQFPTDRLEVRIDFPPSYRDLRPTPQPVVFVGSTEKVHDGETARSRKGFTFHNRIARLKLSAPRQGLNYAIYWMPPE